MSIDLTIYTTSHRRLKLCDLVSLASAKAEELTKFPASYVTIAELEDGRQRTVTEEFIAAEDKVYVLSWQGSDDAVLVTAVDGEELGLVVTFSVGVTRAPTEYVLALVAALAAGEFFCADVYDQSLFWSARGTVDSHAMREELSCGNNFAECCELAARRRGVKVIE